MNTARQHPFDRREDLETVRSCLVIPLTEVGPAEVCF